MNGPSLSFCALRNTLRVPGYARVLRKVERAVRALARAGRVAGGSTLWILDGTRWVPDCAQRIPGCARGLRRVERAVRALFKAGRRRRSLFTASLRARAALAGGCVLLAGCTGGEFGGSPTEQARLDPAQECAIGYDMARQIYTLARVSQTVVRVSPTLGDCGKWAAQYLRRAGFAVDETATRGDAYLFTVTTYEDGDRVIATTALPGLRLTRAYRRAEFGVFPASGFHVTHEGGSG